MVHSDEVINNDYHQNRKYMYKIGTVLKQQQLTFTALPDSSKLERKPWVRNGLNFSGPVESRLHASHSDEGTFEIEDTAETKTL